MILFYDRNIKTLSKIGQDPVVTGQCSQHLDKIYSSQDWTLGFLNGIIILFFISNKTDWTWSKWSSEGWQYRLLLGECNEGFWTVDLHQFRLEQTVTMSHPQTLSWYRCQHPRIQDLQFIFIKYFTVPSILSSHPRSDPVCKHNLVKYA